MSRRARTDGGTAREQAPADSSEQSPATAGGSSSADKAAEVPAGKPASWAPEVRAPSEAPTETSPLEPETAPSTPEGRAHSQTVDMSGRAASYGDPPQMPRTSAPPPLAFGDVEDPTHMPGPKDIPGGEPEDVAPAPGKVPRGDSRSFRRGGEFALVYRIDTYVISRIGPVGKRGQWRVIEYPTTLAASNYYARECSRYVSEGFSDYRD